MFYMTTEANNIVHDAHRVEGDMAHWADVVGEVARGNTVENVANRIVAAVFQRDENTADRGSGQSLQVYDAKGNPTNPSEGRGRVDFQSEVQRLMLEASHSVDSHEWNYMAMLVPRLVGALVLTENHVDRVYKPDLISTVKIAIDWFKRPDIIDQTHIRVGFGGESMVNGRGPAYLVPSLETITAVRNVFARHKNWVLHHELHDRMTAGEPDDGTKSATAKRIDDAIRAQLADRISQLDHGEIRVADPLGEILNNTYLTHDQVSQSIEAVWSGADFLGEPPPYEDLGKKYHFTDKLPTLVLFNAAHAAIEINGRSETDLLDARSQTQHLLKAFVDEYYPHASESVVFQNDKSWEEHDFYTRMMLFYTRDVIASVGNLESVDDRLKQFAHHHVEHNGKTFYGMEGHIMYAVLHPHFFGDPVVGGDRGSVLPSTNVMEDVGAPRHIIFDQGPPEIEFGRYRKAFSENASRPQFIEWLNRRSAAASIDMYVCASAVWEKATELKGLSKKADRTMHSFIRQAVNDVFKGYNESFKRQMADPGDADVSVLETQAGALPKVKKQFLDFLDSNQFEYDDVEKIWTDEDTTRVWEGYIQNLLESRPTESPEELEALAFALVKGQEEIYAFMESVTSAWSLRPDEFREAVGNPIAKEIFYPRSRLERTVSIGENPTYYVTGADSVVWPNRERVSLERYRENVRAAKAQNKRLKGTTGMISSRIAEWKIETDQVIFGPAISEFITSSVGVNEAEASLAADYQKLLDLYIDVDQMEQNKVPGGEIIRVLDSRLDEIKEARVYELTQQVGCDEAWARYYVAQCLSSVVVEANKYILRDAVAEVSQAEALLGDFEKLLEVIDPDPEAAERKYNEFLLRVF